MPKRRKLIVHVEDTRQLFEQFAQGVFDMDPMDLKQVGRRLISEINNLYVRAEAKAMRDYDDRKDS